MTTTKTKGATRHQTFRFQHGDIYIVSEFGIITELRLKGHVTLKELKSAVEDFD